ncbi:MAG: glycosyltransferase family 39 protein [Methanobrevibacter sp.]|jgi:hypothetical protein|nr:glycosyltransferase family 39 protein [Methanobrevibacter sp.]
MAMKLFNEDNIPFIKRVSDFINEKNIAKILFISSFILYFISLFIYYFENVLRYDEVFTLQLVKSSIPNIIYLTSLDVHPPLYYLIVKFFILLGHSLHFPFNDIYLSRLISSFPFLILMIFSWKYLRKDIGVLSAGLFSFCIMSMPHFIHYLAELRMYSYCLLFSTLVFYMAYRITNDGSWKNYALLILFTLLGLYTQYFCGIVASTIYLILLLVISLNNDIDKVKKLFISGIICIFVYLGTWGIYLFHQVKVISSDYWIAPFNSEALINTIIYFLNPLKLSESSVDLITPEEYGWLSLIQEIFNWETVIFLVLLTIVFGIIIKYTFKNGISFNILKDRIVKVNFLTFGALIILIEIIVGIILSECLGKPIIHIRYLFMSIGLFWLTICIVIGKTYHKSKPLFGICMILMVIGGGLSAYDGLTLSVINQRYTLDVDNVLNLIDSNDLIVSNFEMYSYSKIFRPHLDNYFIYEGSLVQNAFLNIMWNQLDMDMLLGDELERVTNTLNSGHKVWIFGSQDKINMEFYYIRNGKNYGFLDNYYAKSYRMSFVSNTKFQIRNIIEISPTPI